MTMDRQETRRASAGSVHNHASYDVLAPVAATVADVEAIFAVDAEHPVAQDGHVDHTEEKVDLGEAELGIKRNTTKSSGSDSDSEEEEAAVVAAAKDEEPSLKDEAQIDGGRLAWQSVLSSFLVHVGAFGVQYSFGFFEAWYEKVEYPNASPSAISLIGSLGPASMFVFGLISGRLAETHGFRPVMLFGAILLTAGMILASFATEIWQLMLTQGIMYGAGSAFCYFPAVSLPTQWWAKRRAFAVGLAVSGSAVGGLIAAQALPPLLESIGSKWTLRVLGITGGSLLLLATILAEPRLPPRKATGPIIDFAMLKNPKFLSMMVGALLTPFGYLVPYYYLPAYSVRVAGHTISFASSLLTVLNIFSIVGRVLTGFAADRIGNLNSFIMSSQFAGLAMLIFWLPAGASTAMLYLMVALFGMFAGGFISLMPTVMAQLFGLAKLPSILGLLYAVTAFGNLSGNPIAGALIDASATSDLFPSKQYGWAIIYASVMMILGTFGTLYLRFVQLDRRFWVAL
ncbi:major facilitator superfamily domain-containing protein [Blastocladiella britannica]|nr:major facilitator superfamily domain-containing protein [Blastocladiella britannica]